MPQYYKVGIISLNNGVLRGVKDMLPTILAEQLQKGLIDYTKTTYPMVNAPFKDSFTNFLKDSETISHKPYIAVKLPFKSTGHKLDCFEPLNELDFVPHIHQQKAFDRLKGEDSHSTIIATGTGSGKTECFLFPILDYCWRHRGEKGIKALIIYPMNALASDQAKRIAKLIYKNPMLRGDANNPGVTAGMYVGGYSSAASKAMTKDTVIADHETLLNNPPDILLTNYKMLDYLLVRPKDAAIWKDNQSTSNLHFIVVDELHTFDGAQGTDLACLLRRLKSRLNTLTSFPPCCIGTSATIGSEDSAKAIRKYAEKIFSEPFEEDSIITEERLTAEDFFDGYEPTDFTVPTSLQVNELKTRIKEDSESEYLKSAVKYWFESFDEDPISARGRLLLREKLMHHGFFQHLIKTLKGNYWQSKALFESLKPYYPEMLKWENPEIAIESIFALISHAREGTEEELLPFLHVQSQLWLRELRRMVALVDPENVMYGVWNDLNADQAQHYLPVINCRECGATGWVTVNNANSNASLNSIEAFYNMYFDADDRIQAIYPVLDNSLPVNKVLKNKVCPKCMHIELAQTNNFNCPCCGEKMFEAVVLKPETVEMRGEARTKYKCPFCGSLHGISLMGLRSTTEISTDLTQIFASKFNDDKKLLAFSDNVQDAAHRAGFFNSGTWRFGLRCAIERYVKEKLSDNNQDIESFVSDFIGYWHEKMPDLRNFIGYFIAPNMVWKKAYEDMVANRKEPTSNSFLLKDIEKRIAYEILLEFGLNSRLGRTLEKSGCATLAFDSGVINTVAQRILEIVRNEYGTSDLSLEIINRYVYDYLYTLRCGGGFSEDNYKNFAVYGNRFMINSYGHDKPIYWMPRLGHRIPKLIAAEVLNTASASEFDMATDKKYVSRIDSFGSEQIALTIFRELCKENIITELAKHKQGDYVVYGINKKKAFVSSKVIQLRCDVCGSAISVAEENLCFAEGMRCRRSGCNGHLGKADDAELTYYGNLYKNADISRINASEHTGLLKREVREKLETIFKLPKEENLCFDPNLLSCTPTMEMGIDIGDLSTVVLCNMPPAQAQFLQRVGRAGRKDGNSMILVVANAKPHDAYFYAEPLDMIQGAVMPPDVFLNASAVLERQFIAFCMDFWVKAGCKAEEIPDHISPCLNSISSPNSKVFPKNFLNFVNAHLSGLYKNFLNLFGNELTKETKDDLLAFATRKDINEHSMFPLVIGAFLDMAKHREALKKNIRELKDKKKALLSGPYDSSMDKEIEELVNEAQSLMAVVRTSINNKNVFNFMSDEGLLPNYAFPEAGIVLKAILRRKYEKDEAELPDEEHGSRGKYERKVYEYARSAASAISEFAPSNSFYAEGHKLTVDRVDLTTAEVVKWRLCPNCSYGSIEGTDHDSLDCPRCHDPRWRDAGQTCDMLKVQMVYSDMDMSQCLISDDSEDRSVTFYLKQLLIDVDEDKDIACAYQMSNDEFPFGYEFVSKATIREINFGENDESGRETEVSGIKAKRHGFRICKGCGKLQPKPRIVNGRELPQKPVHAYNCKYSKSSGNDNGDYANYLYLYREFQTEILRLLIPATTLDTSSNRTESFIAAFMLGMKAHFGNIDHLRAAVSEFPVPGSDGRRQYLVIYDTVPGGTGYLQQLMQSSKAGFGNDLVQIFEKALNILEACNCKNDPQKDGCYHCLYAYRQSQKIGSISRSLAIKLIKDILSGKDNLTSLKALRDLSINPLFDSELERRFVAAFEHMSNNNRKLTVDKNIVNGKEGYVLNIEMNGQPRPISWQIEPQVLLDEEQGISVKCKPDFVLYPMTDKNKRPIAVFTDGFSYHKDIIADDTLKREAIHKSGKYVVWTLSWKDVQCAFEKSHNEVLQTLDYTSMPSGNDIFNKYLNKAEVGYIDLKSLSSFEQLLEYMIIDNSEMIFSVHAEAYSMSLIDKTTKIDENKFNNYRDMFIAWSNTIWANESDDFEFKKSVFGGKASDDDERIYTVIAAKTKGNLRGASVIATINDRDTDSKNYDVVWNGFWRFVNIMQFSEKFAALSELGIEQNLYSKLPLKQEIKLTVESANAKTDPWQETLEIISDEAKVFADKIHAAKMPIPDEIGLEVTDANDAVIAEVEMAWLDAKIAYLTSDQLCYSEILKANGWSVLTDDSEDYQEVLGGTEK